MDLADLNPVGRFSDRAADYVKFRPSYPSAAIDAILADLEAADRLRLADIGAGTGISSRLFADRGVRVTAVEPGAGMRSAAAPHAQVQWWDGRAEATGLPDASQDIVLSAQSFHWFRQLEALEECARILKARGRLAIMWNRRSRSDPFTAGYRQAILDVAGETTAEQMDFDPAVIDRSDQYGRVERLTFPNEQRLDFEGLVGRCHSASYVPKSGPAGERLIELLRALHARHADAAGSVTLVYETEVFRTQKRI
jgi:SAM-dependent methyltransferase